MLITQLILKIIGYFQKEKGGIGKFYDSISACSILD